MPMEENFGDDSVILDRDKAEQALLIAARLQHEHREQLTLAELKRTAAEVDISPVFVEQAVRMLARKKNSPPVSGSVTLCDVLVVLPLVILQCFITLMLVWGKLDLPFCILAVTVAGSAGFLTNNNKRNQNRVLIGCLCVVVLLYSDSFLVHDFEKAYIAWRGGTALLLELASYFGVQFVRAKMGPPQPSADDTSLTSG